MCYSVDMLIINIFFLLKRKAANEKRISDWSSDVCSSVLPIIAPAIATEDRNDHAAAAMGWSGMHREPRPRPLPGPGPGDRASGPGGRPGPAGDRKSVV